MLEQVGVESRAEKFFCQILRGISIIQRPQSLCTSVDTHSTCLCSDMSHLSENCLVVPILNNTDQSGTETNLKQNI